MNSMESFLPYAETHNFLLILPLGIQNSFNAGTCCGYAHQNQIHDVDFLVHLQKQLSSEFSFVESEFAYAVGHSNGAFLITYAMQQHPHLFRAIAPIGGYATTKDDGFGMLEDLGVGMMLHHSLDDWEVRPSGCCADEKLPVCHLNGMEVGGGSGGAGRCVSVLDVFDTWARTVNRCDDTPLLALPEGVTGNGAFGSGGMGESAPNDQDENDVVYLLSFFDDETIFSFRIQTTSNIEQDENPLEKLFSTKMPISVTYINREKKVTCITATSSSCIANTTMCLYSNEGHFDEPNFGTSFFMDTEVFDFFARDLCELNDGIWRTTPEGAKKTKSCDCSVTGSLRYGGVYCLDALNEDGTFVSAPKSTPSEEFSPAFSNSTGLAAAQIKPGPSPYGNKTVVGIVGSLILILIGIVIAGVITVGRRRRRQQQYYDFEFDPNRSSRGSPDNPLFFIDRGGIDTSAGGYYDFFRRSNNTTNTIQNESHGYKDGAENDLELSSNQLQCETEMVGRESMDSRGGKKPPHTVEFDNSHIRRHESAPGRIPHMKAAIFPHLGKDMLKDIKTWKKKRSNERGSLASQNLHRNPEEYYDTDSMEVQKRHVFKRGKEWNRKKRRGRGVEPYGYRNDDDENKSRASSGNESWYSQEENSRGSKKYLDTSDVDEYDFFNDRGIDIAEKEELKEIETYQPDP
ncbi:hypothetical protein ACHAXS_003258 [Conticribra weissflogii]